MLLSFVQFLSSSAVQTFTMQLRDVGHGGTD